VACLLRILTLLKVIFGSFRVRLFCSLSQLEEGGRYFGTVHYYLSLMIIFWADIGVDVPAL